MILDLFSHIQVFQLIFFYMPAVVCDNNMHLFFRFGYLDRQTYTSVTKVDVSRIAQYFGGGGHKKAAGFTMTGTPFDVLNNLSKQIEAQMEKLEKTQEQ